MLSSDSKDIFGHIISKQVWPKIDLPSVFLSWFAMHFLVLATQGKSEHPVFGAPVQEDPQLEDFHI